jgi:alpha 1,3-glucosidase
VTQPVHPFITASVPLSFPLLEAYDELTRMRSLVVAAWLFLLLPTPSVVAVKEQDFKKCNESAFCRRGRALADRAAEYVKSGEKWKSPYSLDASTIVLEDGGSRFTGRVRSSLYPEIKFELDVRVHEDGVVRVRMDEKEGLRKRYDEAASWALLKEPVLSPSSKWSVGKKEVKVVYGEKRGRVEVMVVFEPLVVRMKRNGKDQVVLNGQGLLHMEHFREKVEKKVEEVEAKDEDVPPAESEEAQKVIQLPPNAWFEGDTEDGLWQESWRSWTDTKPKGAPSYSFYLISQADASTRPRVPFPRYQLPKSRSRLWYPATCYQSGPSNHQRRRCILR